MPADLHAAASSSLILREASLMSVSPVQNTLKPSPVPGPLTVNEKWGFDAARASATPVEIGSTVEDPDTLIEPETAGALALAPALSLELAAGLVSVLGAALGAAVAAPPLLQ